MKLNEIEITDFNAPELDIYARFNEAQLLHYFEPAPGVFIAESPKVIERALNAGYAPISFLAEKRLVAADAGETRQLLEKYPDVPVFTAEYNVLTKLTGFALTRGMLCAMKRNVLMGEEPLSVLLLPCMDAVLLTMAALIQYTAAPPGGEHGNCIPDPMDHSSQKFLARCFHGYLKSFGL